MTCLGVTFPQTPLQSKTGSWHGGGGKSLEKHSFQSNKLASSDSVDLFPILGYHRDVNGLGHFLMDAEFFQVEDPVSLDFGVVSHRKAPTI